MLRAYEHSTFSLRACGYVLYVGTLAAEDTKTNMRISESPCFDSFSSTRGYLNGVATGGGGLHSI